MLGARVLQDRVSKEGGKRSQTRIHYKIRPSRTPAPIVNVRSAHLRRNRGRFYVDTGADVSLIKKECVINGEINREKLVTISGITPGKCVTLGSISVELSGHPCEAQVIPDDFPIDTDGLLGCDMLMLKAELCGYDFEIIYRPGP